jgi:hypothetical protein
MEARQERHQTDRCIATELPPPQSTTALVVALEATGPEDTRALATGLCAAFHNALRQGGCLLHADPRGASFGFPEDAMDSAIAFARAAVEPPADSEVRWKAAIGVGSLAIVRHEGSDPVAIGAAPVRATELVKMSRPCEVLVDQASSEARVGALPARETRSSRGSTGRIRAVVLEDQDTLPPTSTSLPTPLEAIVLREGRLIGRERALAEIAEVAAGGLGVVRGPHGIGGTRFLAELAQRTVRAMRIAPSGCGAEPLGALRLAISDDLTRHAPPRLPSDLAIALGALLDGRTVAVSIAAELIACWTASRAEELPLVLLDDAALIDLDTLHAVALAAEMQGTRFAVVARLLEKEPLPLPLTGLPVEANTLLAPLAPSEIDLVLGEMLGETPIDAELRQRWIRRCAGAPFELVTSVRHDVETGRVGMKNGTLVPLTNGAGRGRNTAMEWASLRVAMLWADRPADASVFTIAALAGALLDAQQLEEIVADLGMPRGRPLRQIVARLVREGFLAASGPVIAPSSRTVRSAGVDWITRPLRARFHASIAAVIAASTRGSDRAEAELHSMRAHDGA